MLVSCKVYDPRKKARELALQTAKKKGLLVYTRPLLPQFFPEQGKKENRKAAFVHLANAYLADTFIDLAPSADALVQNPVLASEEKGYIAVSKHQIDELVAPSQGGITSRCDRRLR